MVSHYLSFYISLFQPHYEIIIIIIRNLLYLSLILTGPVDSQQQQNSNDNNNNNDNDNNNNNNNSNNRRSKILNPFVK